MRRGDPGEKSQGTLPVFLGRAQPLVCCSRNPQGGGFLCNIQSCCVAWRSSAPWLRSTVAALRVQPGAAGGCPALLFFLLLPHCWTPETHLLAVPSGFQPFFCPLHPFTGRILPRAGGDRASPSQHLLFLVPPLLHPTQLVSPGCAPGPSSCRVLVGLVLFPKNPWVLTVGLSPWGGSILATCGPLYPSRSIPARIIPSSPLKNA